MKRSRSRRSFTTRKAPDAQIKSVVYTTEGSKVLFTDTTPRVLSADSSVSIDWKYVTELAKKTTITVTVVVEMEGKEYTFSAAVDLDVQDVSSLAYVGVDASHNNEYVSGYNKGLMGNFTTIAADSTVRVDMLDTSEKLIAACKDGQIRGSGHHAALSPCCGRQGLHRSGAQGSG